MCKYSVGNILFYSIAFGIQIQSEPWQKNGFLKFDEMFPTKKQLLQHSTT